MVTLELMESLGRCQSAQDVLTWLLEGLTDSRFRAIRYYHYDPAQERLVSIDSAGMPHSVAKDLRYGAIIRFMRNTPLENHDSFWCFQKKEPVLFVVDANKARFPLRPKVVLSDINLIYLREDNCRQELAGAKTPIWVDCPLIVADRCIGKLSCDFEPTTSIRRPVRTAIRRLWAMGQLVAPTLEFLHSESLAPLAQIRDEIAKCTSLRSLFSYCTRNLARQHFNCKHASLFTYSKDLFGSRKLILRKTSFKKLQAKENKAFYDMREKALTTWVLRHDEPVRLHRLEDQEALREQLDAYGRGIAWLNKHSDSDAYQTYLGVPLGSKGNPLGVLRYTEKAGSEFTESDQILLGRVAKDYISPRLQILSRSEFVPDLVDQLQEVHSISLAFTSRHRLPSELCSAMKNCFPETSGNQKLYLINLLEQDGTHFRHYAIGGNLRVETRLQERYDLAGSFTRHVMDAGTNTAVLVNDLPLASLSGGFHAICPAAVCALGSPLVFGGQPFGALVVMSERYDLLELSHRHFLAILAGEVSQLFGLKQVLGVSSGLLGMRHDCAALLLQIAHLIEERPEGWEEDSTTLVRFLLETVDTYCRPGARRPEVFARYYCEETDVRDEILLAAAAARQEMRNISGIDCRIDKELRAVVHPSYLMNIAYNLLKNAWAASRNGPKVVATAKVAEGYLDVSITDQGSGLSAEAIREYNAADALTILQAGLLHRRVQGLGLLVAQRIAEWHALPDGRRGDVKLEQGDGGIGIRAKIRLPIHQRDDDDGVHSAKETGNGK